jgi:hypothetical protein
MWVIFSFIVRLLSPFGMHSSIVSVCLGLCLDGLLICLLGDQQAILRVLLFGRWCLCAYCDVFGGKETIGVLRIASCLLFSFNTLYLWTSAYVSPVVISFHVFLAVFARLLGGFSCILHVYLGAPYTFNNTWIIYPKKMTR